MNSGRARTILYCHAKRQTRTVSAGHWFFHTGQWAQCAEASGAKDQWLVRITFEAQGKPLAVNPVAVRSLEEAKAFVAEYFDAEVQSVSPSSLPRPSDL